MLLHYLAKRRNTKIRIFTQMLYQCIARIQPVAPWFLQSFWLTTYNHAAVWLSKSCSKCVQLGAVGWHGLGERKSREPQQLDCVVCTIHVHQCAVFLKEKMSSMMFLIASDICWDSKISHLYCPLTFTLGLMKNNSHLLHSNRHRDRLGKHTACG